MKRHCNLVHQSVKQACAVKGTVGRKRTKTAHDAAFACRVCEETFSNLTRLRERQKETSHSNLKKQKQSAPKKLGTSHSLRNANLIIVDSSSESDEDGDWKSDIFGILPKFNLDATEEFNLPEDLRPSELDDDSDY